MGDKQQISGPNSLSREDSGKDTGKDSVKDSGEQQPTGKPGDRTAVALSYEIGGENLPKVVATGRGQLAEDIVRLAFDAGVKVREDADLAQLLVTLDLDTEIPTEAMEAVAEILAYVYKANGKMADMQEAADALNAAEAAREAAGESGADPVDQGRRNLADPVRKSNTVDKPDDTTV